MRFFPFFRVGLITLYACASVVSAQAPALSPSTNPVCYVCGGDPNAIMNEPSGVIVIPPEYGLPVDTLLCSQIRDAGLQGFIPADACAIIVADTASQEICGCSNLEPPVPSPVAPVTPPTTPVAPVTPPTTPVAPVDLPTTPVAPVTPVAPTPVAPVTPVAPTPVAPVTPVAPTPVAPVTPVAPTPVAPVTPVAPTPVAPVTPVAPTSDGECEEGKSKGGMGMSKGKGSESGKGKGDSGEGKGGGGMMMGKTKSCKEPKTPKAGGSTKKEKEGKGKMSTRLRV